MSDFFRELPSDNAEAIEYVKELLSELPPDIRKAIKAEVGRNWLPLPGPQSVAYTSEANELFYGGAAGGGKTDLLLGLAHTAHQNAIIYRREYKQLRHIIERGKQIFGSSVSWNGTDHIWRGDGWKIRLGAVEQKWDVEKFMGNPHDFIGFDELPHFLEFQYRTLKGWARTTDPDQKVRIVSTGNPPLTKEGNWVTEYWGPWLNPKDPHYPVPPGVLCWFISDENGNDRMVDGPDPVKVGSDWVHPLSRTFIPARVEDNPFYMESGYKKQLQALPEPLRSMLLRGEFGLDLEPVIGQTYSRFSYENVIPVEYDPKREVMVAFDFNRVPAVALVGHELQYGEYPKEHARDGTAHFGVFGEIFNTQGVDVETLALWLVRGETESGGEIQGWHMPENFEGLRSHGNKIYVYGDASGNQKRAEAKGTAWQQVSSVFYETLKKRFAGLMIPKANPGIFDSKRAVQDKLFDLFEENRSLWIDPRCEELIKDLEQVRDKEDGTGIFKESNSDKPYFLRTHISDALRYLIWKRYPPRSRVPDKGSGYLDTQDMFKAASGLGSLPKPDGW